MVFFIWPNWNSPTCHEAKIRMAHEEGGELCIEVEDQGKGFDPEILSSSSLTHFGLFNIRERLKLLGCRMNIESEPGKGTRCTIYSPVEDTLPCVEKALELEPDVIIMDISMPRMTGIDATRKIKEIKPDTKIIGHSLHEADYMAVIMLQAGASAYHCKTGPVDDLLRSIRDVYDF